MYTDSAGSVQGAPGFDSRRKCGVGACGSLWVQDRKQPEAVLKLEGGGCPSGCGIWLNRRLPEAASSTTRGLDTSAGVGFCKKPV